MSQKTIKIPDFKYYHFHDSFVKNDQIRLFCKSDKNLSNRTIKKAIDAIAKINKFSYENFIVTFIRITIFGVKYNE